MLETFKQAQECRDFNQKKLQKLIDKDPVLQKLKADVDKLNYKYKPEIDKLKNDRPEMFRMFQDWGLIPNDYN